MEETKEIWKDITGYEGLYKVSNLGMVKSLERKVWNGKGYIIVRERILKPGKDKGGYLKVHLCKDGKAKSILLHRLVADEFIDNIDNLPQINHKDENPSNNNVNNLEWCTQYYNNNYGNHNERVVKATTNNPKLSKKVICLETNQIYPSTMEVKRQFGFSQGNIYSCCIGKRNTCGGYHWKFVD